MFKSLAQDEESFAGCWLNHESVLKKLAVACWPVSWNEMKLK